jgi:hypothetical protein
MFNQAPQNQAPTFNWTGGMGNTPVQNTQFNAFNPPTITKTTSDKSNLSTVTNASTTTKNDDFDDFVTANKQGTPGVNKFSKNLMI